MLRSVLGIDQTADRSEAGRHLRRRIAEVEPQFEPYLPLLALPIDADVPMTPEMAQLAPEFRNRLLNDVVARLLTLMIDQPAIIIFEDAGFMDDSSADLFTHALTNIDRRPWMVLISRREQASGLHGGRGFPVTSLELHPLDQDELLALAHQLCEHAPIPSDELSELVERAGGNPLFLLELVRARMEAGRTGHPPVHARRDHRITTGPTGRRRPADPPPRRGARRSIPPGPGLDGAVRPRA